MMSHDDNVDDTADTDRPDNIDSVDSNVPDTPDADNADNADDSDSDAADDSDADAADRSIIRAGRNFEATYRLDASEAGEFLIALGRQLRDADELTLADDEWELPFAFGEPVELEVDFDGMDDPELEIELELPGRTDETAPEVS